MRKLLLFLLVGASACAARASRPTVPVQYACGDVAIVRQGATLAPIARTDVQPTHLGWSDHDGDHFVAWPVSPVAVEAVEFVVPNDPRQDAMRRVYDTSKGASTADWRLLERQVCTAHGGYSDVLARYLRGDTLDQLAKDLTRGDRDAARNIVRLAMVTLQKRYFRDR